MKVNKKSSDFTSFDIGATQEAKDNASAIDEATSTKYEKVDIPLEDIEFNPINTRFRNLDTDESITELAESINNPKIGLIHPIAVYKHGNKYMLISGERRTRAFMLLNRRTIPAYVLEDMGDLENMERLYEANLQSRELDIRTRFFAVKDLLEKYENSDIQTEELAKKARLTKTTFLKHKKMLMDAEDGDIALLESGDITWAEFVIHTQSVLAEREKSAYKKRIDLFCDNEDIFETNYKDPATGTVYSVEQDEAGKYCSAVTDNNLFKVPLHYQNQVFDTFEEAQVSLNLYAISNKLSIYNGDFSEFQKQETSSRLVPDSAPAQENDTETEKADINEEDFGPSLHDTIPTQYVGSEEESENGDSTSSDKTAADDDEDETESEVKPEPSEKDSKDAKQESLEDKTEPTKVPSGAAQKEDAPAKNNDGKSEYLKQYALFSGYSAITKKEYQGALWISSTDKKVYIITELSVNDSTPIDRAMRKGNVLFIEVEPTTVRRYEIK